MERHCHHSFASILDGFFDCVGNFISLTVSVSDSSGTVTDDDKCREAESPTALHDACATAYLYDFFLS